MSEAGILEKASAKARALTRGELAALIDWPDLDALFKAAYAVKLREIGPRVSLRGLIEFGNVCEKTASTAASASRTQMCAATA